MDNKLTREQAKNIVTTLALMRLRPDIYFADRLENLLHWWMGFTYAFDFVDINFTAHEEKYFLERGWDVQKIGAIEHMQLMDLSEDEIIIEYMTVIILMVQAETKMDNSPIFQVHESERKVCEVLLRTTPNDDKTNIEKCRNRIQLINTIEADMLNR